MISITSPPAVEPLSRQEAKDHLRVDLADEDRLIDAAVIAARRFAEGYTHRAFITQTAEIITTGFCDPVFTFPIAPVQSIASVQYVDTAGATQTWPASNYRLVKTGLRPALAPVFGGVWPTLQADYDNVTVTVVAGYGDTADDVPEDIRQAIRLLVGHFYENRNEEIAGTIVSRVTLGAKQLLQPHVIHV